MNRTVIRSITFALLCSCLFVFQDDISSVYTVEFQGKTNPHRGKTKQASFLSGRSIASTDIDSTDRVTKLSRIKDSEHTLVNLKSCYRVKCTQFSIDSYYEELNEEVSTELEVLHKEVIANQFKASSIVSTVSTFTDIEDPTIARAILLLLSSQDKSDRSLNILIKMSKFQLAADIHVRIISELEVYAGSNDFKDKFSSQLITELSQSNEERLLSNDIHRFITRDNYKKFTVLLTRLPSDSKLHAEVLNSINKARANL